MGPVQRVLLASGVGLVVFLLAATWLGRLEQGGPVHDDLVLEGGIPATLYLPEGLGEGGLFLEAPPADARPPAVALMHGYASDRAAVSSLARGLAGAGYAVLSFDAAGHGANRNPFSRSRSRPDVFYAEFSAAVDHLRSLPFVDGERIAVMGHSMGAGAALDFATRDSGLDAVVLVSGGLRALGPQRPPNTLFIYADGEVPFIAERCNALAADLAGVAAIEPGRLYGDPTAGTAVRVVVVEGTDHASIALSGETVDEVVTWLDAAFGLPPRERRGGGDPRRLPTALAALSLLLVLPGLGVVVGRVVPSAAERPARVGRGLASLAAALLVTLPLLGLGAPLSVLSVDVGDVVVSQLAAAGGVLLVWLALRDELAGPWPRLLPSALGAAAAVFGVFLLLQPMGAVIHRVTFTPERAIVFAAATPFLLPFAFAFQLLVRRGTARQAALGAVAGRILVLGALAVGVATGILPRVVLLMLPGFVVVFTLFELLSATIYTVSRNLLTIALIDAALIALLVATGMPIRL
jgi:dienelactone hydrolase